MSTKQLLDEWHIRRVTIKHDSQFLFFIAMGFFMAKGLSYTDAANLALATHSEQ